MLTLLGLVMRGLRWRWVSSVAMALVAVVAMVGAALGPLYANSAADSLVREGLAQAAPASTGVLVRAQHAGQTQFSPAELLDAASKRAADPALDPWYEPGTLALTATSVALRLRDNPIGTALIGWHRGQCGAVDLTSGACPTASGEAMISSRMAEQFDIVLGDSLRLGISDDVATDQVEVVGTYDADTADPAVWGLVSPAQFQPSQAPDGPDRLDEIVVDQATFLQGSGDVAATSFRALDATTVHAADLPDLRRAVESSVAPIPASAGAGPQTVASSGLPAFLDSLDPDLADVGAASFAVTASLVLLAWFALFLLVSATGEERSGEVALAKLRGMPPRSAFLFGVGEPLLILLAAVPVGLAAAFGINRYVAGAVMSEGTDTRISSAALIALAIGFLGGVVAATLASRRIITAPVVEQLRHTGGRRAQLARSVAVDAFAIALLAAGVYQLRRGGSDALALLTPSLVALTMGLLAVRVVPPLARGEVARTRGSRRVAGFLAASNIARRPGGLRTVVLLALAVGWTVFAVDGWAVASANRNDVAPAEVGGWQVLHVRSYSPGSLLTAVQAADPSGTHALAAVASSAGTTGGLIAVDAARLGAIAAWDPAWTGSSREGIGPMLHPEQAAAPIPVHGSLAIDMDVELGAGSGSVALAAAVRDGGGILHTVDLGELRPGMSTYRADLPVCVAAPCTLAALTFTPTPLADKAAATVTITGAQDAEGEVDLTSSGSDGWRSGATSFLVRIGPLASVSVDESGHLVVSFDIQGESAAIEVADHPTALPVYLGSDTAQREGQGAGSSVTDLDGRVVPSELLGSGVLPRKLRSGALADLPFAMAVMGSVPTVPDYQVWLSADAPPSIRTALEAEGFSVVSVDSVDARLAELSRGSAALSLRLFLMAAIVALLVAAGTVLAGTYISARRRAYELAAMRSLGADNRVLVRSGRLEQVALALAGTAVGLAAGLVGAALTLPNLLMSASADYPAPWFGPAWLPVLATVAGVLVLLAVVAEVGARRTARLAQPDLLRAVQE
ncbi:MAG: FtsX-like permease family protein [Actinomycetales bacterium]|nr:FtsX-like permease family protein [Actinomycetales bacterium]